MAISIRDKDLIAKSFKLMCTGIKNVTVRDHLNWSAYYNIFTTSVGDNRYMNPLPQFSPATDPRYTRFINSKEGGMGPQFKKLYDDNATILTLTMGTPEFTGLLSFIANMFDPVAAIMANKGRAPGLAFYFGQAVGTIAFFPIQLLSIGLQFLNFLAGDPKNQFWYVKPAMGQYITGCNNFLNDLMVNQGYINPVLPRSRADSQQTQGAVNPYNYSAMISTLNSLFPSAINSDGTIDLMRLVGKGTRKYRAFLEKVKALDDDLSITTVQEKTNRIAAIAENINFNGDLVAGIGLGTSDILKAELDSVGNYRGKDEGAYPEVASAFLDKKAYSEVNPGGGVNSVNVSAIGGTTVSDMNNSLNAAGEYGPSNAGANPNDTARAPNPATPSSVQEAQQANKTTYEDNPNDMSWAGQVWDFLKLQAQGGFDAISFRVEHNGQVSDSFSNTAGESPMKAKFNSTVQQANNFKFDMAGGATGVDILDGMINMLKDGITGMAASVSIANIPMALANNSFIEIADHWQDSSVSLHRESYKIKLVSHYAHPYSQITNLWVPFSLIFPSIVPLNAGGAAYTSPYMLKAFCKSRSIIRTGMVESATITFGEGPLGWTRDRKPLNITIDFTIVDLEKVLSLPISRAISPLDITNPAALVSKMLTDVGKYNDWLARVSGSDYLDTVLKYSQLNKRLTMGVRQIEQGFSAGNVAGWLSDSVPMSVAQLFYRPIAR